MNLRKVNKGNCKVLHLWRNNSSTNDGGHPSGKQFGRKDPGSPGEHKINTSPQGVLAVKKENGILGYIRQNTSSRWRTVILPDVVRSHLECCVQF